MTWRQGRHFQVLHDHHRYSVRNGTFGPALRSARSGGDRHHGKDAAHSILDLRSHLLFAEIEIRRPGDLGAVIEELNQQQVIALLRL